MTDWATKDIDKLSEQIMRWRIEKGFITNWTNVPEKLMLIVSECAEVMEVYRDIPTEHGVLLWKPLKHAQKIEEELADILIRVLDLSASLGLSVGRATEEKMNINKKRPFRHGRQR